ncbi:MAG TPA: class I SAM-dependent methyltransferase [Gemmataceae bacterium]|nr:class I SAM-dependent methyltransferase [Gemmataceae bacterium]
MTRTRLLIGLAALVGCALLASQTAVVGQDKNDKITCQIIYVPTPQAVVDKMLDMAKVTDKDFVVDLGCGDGRVVATAAKKYNAKGLGVDIDPDRIKDCEETLKKMEIKQGMVEIRQGDALKVPAKDLNKTTVVMLYMLDEFMGKLETIAKKDLPKGCRIVSHDFKFPNWEPDQTVEFMGPERTHTLYMWTVK